MNGGIGSTIRMMTVTPGNDSMVMVIIIMMVLMTMVMSMMVTKMLSLVKDQLINIHDPKRE